MLELTVLPTSLKVIEELDDCDGFIVGETDFSLRMPTYFAHQEIAKIVELVKASKQKVYIALNIIVHEDELELVDKYLDSLKRLNIDGIIFGDLAVYNLAKKHQLIDKLIYNPETYLTNYESVNFFARKGIKRVSIAKEITLEDIKTIANKKLIEVEILGHGASNMFHSMRDLVSNYYRFLKHDNPYEHQNEELYLIEEIRDERYPIIEDQNGTHVFSSHDLCTINYLDIFIENNVSSIRIDGLFKDDDVLIQIVKIYRKAIDDYRVNKEMYLNNKNSYIEMLNNIKNIRPFDEGFLFKKTVYKGETNERNR